MSELELQYENNRLERELAAAKSEIEPLKNSWNLSVQAFDISESENKRLREALDKISEQKDKLGIPTTVAAFAKSALDGNGGEA